MVADPDTYPFGGSLPSNDDCALKLSTDVFGLPMAVNPQQEEAWAAVKSHPLYFQDLQDHFNLIASLDPEIKPATAVGPAVSADGKGAPMPSEINPPGFDEGVVIDHQGIDIGDINSSINANPSSLPSQCLPSWASDYDNFVTQSLDASAHAAVAIPSSSPSFQGFAATNKTAGAACLLPTPPATTAEVVPFDWGDLTTVSSNIPQVANAPFAWHNDSPLGDIALPPPLSSSSSRGTAGVDSPDVEQTEDNFALPSPVSLQGSPNGFGSRWRLLEAFQPSQPSLEAPGPSADLGIPTAQFTDERNQDVFIEPTQTLNDRNSLCVPSLCGLDDASCCHQYHDLNEFQSPEPLTDETGIMSCLAPKQWMHSTQPSAGWNDFAPTLALSPSEASPLDLMQADTSMGPTGHARSVSFPPATTDQTKPRITRRRKTDVAQKSGANGNTRLRKTSNAVAHSTRSSVSSNTVSKLNAATKRSAPSTPSSSSISSDVDDSPSPCGSPCSKKRVGKRKGPLRPDQRRQASEIRKLRACLRCKFLKKTCDKGEPCSGCQPAHARLWQVPCTRIDIKDIGYFMEDWSADYNSHPAIYFSILHGKNNDVIYGLSDVEHTLRITHGFGQGFCIKARELFVPDDSCFRVDWLEFAKNDHDRVYGPHLARRPTWKLSIGAEGVSQTCLSEYLDRHIDADGIYEGFVDDFFAQAPFLTEMLKTIHRFYARTGSKIIRRALKLILAYNLTQNITWLDGFDSEMDPLSTQSTRNHDSDPTRHHRMVAPVFVNFAVKRAMAQLWRDLQRQVLEDLSSLYSGVYAGDKLKNWPIIFMVAVILLNVWEEMEFDSHYRIPDPHFVSTFCEDMEGTPVGVIIGLFHAISQKVPAILDWNTRRYGNLFQGDASVCDALTEMRSHAEKYEGYLRGCREGKHFVRDDFDSLANKFVAKLVIR